MQHHPLASPSVADRRALGLAGRVTAVAALTAVVGGSLVPAGPTPTPAPHAAEGASVSPAAPALAAPVREVGGFRAVDDENVVEGAGTTEIPVHGVEADPQVAARGDVAPEEVAALTSAEDTDRFLGLGVTWDVDAADEVVSVSVRLRESGVWTEWNDLQLMGDDAGAVTDRAGTEPLLTDGADGYQVQVLTASGRTPAGLQVSLMDPGVGSLDAEVVDRARETAEAPAATLSAARVDAATGEAVPAATRVNAVSDRLMPTIVRRSAWGADESVTRGRGQNARLTALFLHHTASSNNYSKATAAAQVRSIQLYHAKSLGWGDIGYHVLVDKFGTIYEGARGSLDSLPVGAHAYAFNRDTFAVSALGNYEVAAPSPAMVDSITRVFAWKAAAYGLDPAGTATLVSGGNPKWPAGARVPGDVIRGHYTSAYTACPGANLTARLPQIRRDAAALVTRAGGSAAFITPDRTSTTTPVPAPSSSPTSPAAARYTVRPNDGWWTISRRTGVPAATLQRLNGLTGASVIHPGQVLVTAGAAASAPASPATGAPATRVVTGAPLVNLRAGASTGTALLARIKATTRVTVTRTSAGGGWAYVTHPTFEGWMSTAYLR